MLPQTMPPIGRITKEIAKTAKVASIAAEGAIWEKDDGDHRGEIAAGRIVEPFDELADEAGIQNLAQNGVPERAPYRWEFEENGHAFDVAVPACLTTNDMQVMIRTALAGGGITFGMEETFRPWLGEGRLTSILDRFLPPFQAFYLFCPSRRKTPPKLRAMIDHVRRHRVPGLEAGEVVSGIWTSR